MNTPTLEGFDKWLREYLWLLPHNDEVLATLYEAISRNHSSYIHRIEQEAREDGARKIDSLRELLLRSGENEKGIVLKEMYDVARRLEAHTGSKSDGVN